MYTGTTLEALAHARASELSALEQTITHRRQAAHILRVEKLERALSRARRELAAVRTALTTS